MEGNNVYQVKQGCECGSVHLRNLRPPSFDMITVPNEQHSMGSKDIIADEILGSHHWALRQRYIYGGGFWNPSAWFIPKAVLLLVKRHVPEAHTMLRHIAAASNIW